MLGLYLLECCNSWLLWTLFFSCLQLAFSLSLLDTFDVQVKTVCFQLQRTDRCNIKGSVTLQNMLPVLNNSFYKRDVYLLEGILM